MNDVENKLLAACFFEPEVPMMVSSDTEIFANANNKIVAEAIKSLVHQSTGITTVSVIAEIKILGYQNNVWDSYIEGIYSQYTPEDYDHLISVLQVERRKRLTIKAAENLIKNTEKEGPDAAMTSFNKDISGEGVAKKRLTVGDISKKIYEKARASRENFEKTGEYITERIKSDMAPIDDKLGGYKKGEMYIVAARPGMGKTSFILQTMSGFEEYGYGVMGSLEMKNEDMIARKLAQKSGVNSNHIMQGTFEDPAGWERFLNAVLDDRDSKIIPYDGTKFIDDFCAKLRQYKITHDIQWAIIDHLGKVKVKMYRAGMHEKYTAISNKLADIAQELNIVLIGLSQLGREVDKRTPPKPRVSDIRGSGAIEEDAASIILIYRPEYYEIYDDDNGNRLNEGHTYFLIPKNRFGEPNQVAIMDFQKEYSRFIEPLTTSF